MGQLDQLVAVITGGGRGIGRAIALRYAAEGARIVISSRTGADLDATLAESGVGEEAGLAVVADATDRDDARRPVEEALRRFGRVDVLVNNVGGHLGRRDAFSDDGGAFERTLVLSLTSAWWTTTAALPSMRSNGFGRIISIGSGASKRTGASVAYAAAKHGLVGFTRQLAADAARTASTSTCCARVGPARRCWTSRPSRSGRERPRTPRRTGPPPNPSSTASSRPTSSRAWRPCWRALTGAASPARSSASTADTKFRKDRVVTTMSAIYWDPFDEEIDTSPHEVWRRMRAEMPLYRNDKYDFWALSRHADVHAAHVDPQTYLSGYGTVLELMGSDMSSTGQMIFMDGQQHNKMRLLVSKAFTRSRVAALEDRIRQFSCELLDAQVGSGGFDYLDDFGAQLPSLVISSLLGVSPADRPAVLELINTVFHIEPDVGMMNDVSFGARIGLNTYLIEQLADRRRTPRDDMITALTEAELTEDGTPRRLNDQEAADFANLLISCRHRDRGATARLGRGHPCRPSGSACRHGERLRPDPRCGRGIAALRGAVAGQGRTLSRPVELHGETLPTGAKILLLTGSAGRDERVWERADDFDVKRKPEQHVSFGIGAHFCLGAALARMEGRIALEETLARFPSWDVDHAHAVRLHTSTVRGYKSVPISPVVSGRARCRKVRR